MKEKKLLIFWVLLSLALHLALLVRIPGHGITVPPRPINLVIHLLSGPASWNSATTEAVRSANTREERRPPVPRQLADPGISATSAERDAPTNLPHPLKKKTPILPDTSITPLDTSSSTNLETEPETSPLEQPPPLQPDQREIAQGPPSPTPTNEETENPEETTVPGTAGIATTKGAPSGKPAISGSSVVTPLAYGTNPPPPYPAIARRRGWQGEVILLIKVTANGRVHMVTVEKSSGFSILDNEARKAAYRWHFLPGRRNGRPVPGEVLVPIRFDLKEAE